MESEKLRIFDEHRKEIGVATREEVHRHGHWHEAFHCWLVSREEGIDYIYLQIRSPRKKDYPNLIDITAAGHLLAHETIQDGIREVKEEIGIDISFEELIKLGVIEYSVTKENFIDNELANVFLYQGKFHFDQFKLQEEEVSGMVRADFNAFSELWLGGRDEIRVGGFEIDQDGNKILIDKFVGKNKFVPHLDSYYESIISLIRGHI